ncbi:MAG: ABC transporter ATP-binding protein [Gracilimonas sp.]|uniref:ABC transporter ATP-binding protein n=1 Tax=Gracilimonas TaxID=649462 RepID=UPI001B191CCA|nr:ABC transporter ATP-binding protein [Gracilimonas sp.]MBO6584827.1 ABC transporter ATP-binding protein [Gracilimonas sp.]MBO6615902.1 ABC transporter ATP-binding protein [Gracilimonas sp.]
MERAVELKNLDKSYEDTPVLKNLNLEIPKGTVFGLIGPNGAGKSTLIGVLTGLLSFEGGDVIIHGMKLNARNELEIKKLTASVLQPPLLFEQFSSLEFIEYVCEIYEVNKEGLIEKAYSLMDYFDIKDFAKIKVNKLSSGSRKKLAFVTSVLVEPKLLLLDEPFEAVDVISIERMKNIIRRLKQKGVTIIVTSHILEVVENLCDDIAILHHGHIKAYLDSVSRKELQKDSSLHEIFEKYVEVEQKEEIVDWL